MLTIPRDREFLVEHTCYDDVELQIPSDLSVYDEFRAHVVFVDGSGSRYSFPLQVSIRDGNVLMLRAARSTTYTFPLGLGQVDVVGILRGIGGYRDETILPVEPVEVIDLPTDVSDIARVPDFSEIYNTYLTTGPVPLPL